MADLICIGTSGWNYQGWKHSFYAGIAAKHWLNYCAHKFTGIEVNATFYGLQKRSTFARWREQTPEDFKFAVKGNRYVTHNKKLKDPAEPLRLEKERCGGLGDKLAAVLWQLPGNWHKNVERLAAFADHLSRWQETRHVIEFRHPSWFDDEVAACLNEHRIAVCLSDAADWPMWDRVTPILSMCGCTAMTGPMPPPMTRPSLPAGRSVSGNGAASAMRCMSTSTMTPKGTPRLMPCTCWKSSGD
jgi:uncharacterized protein YecE (DUF72 family)